MKLRNCALITPLFLIAGCDLDSDSNKEEKFDISNPYVIDFNKSTQGFTAIFSDYPLSTDDQNNETFYELSATYGTLPAPLNDKKGIKLAGNNHSDDLLMAVKGEVAGLEANTLYKISLTLTFATSAPSNCFGVGGAPGESVYVKLGASNEEPKNTDDNGMYRLNIDIGQQSTSGSHGETVGDLANGLECGTSEQYVQKTLATTRTFDVISNERGKFWVIAATDSAFEGLSDVYFNKLTVNISK